MRKASALAAAVAAAFIGTSALAQSVITFNTNWSNLDGLPAAGNVSAYDAGGVVQDNAATSKNVTTPGWTSPNPPARVPTFFSLASLSGVAIQNGNATEDRYLRGITTSQTFTINSPAWVALPTYINGNIVFAQGANASQATTVTASVQITDG